MADIFDFKTGRRPTKKLKVKKFNPIRPIICFLSLILVALALLPFLFLCVCTIPFMPKKYWEIIEPGINSFHTSLMDFLRELEGNNNE